MAEEISKSFLGTGWSFPPSFNKVQATIAMTSDVEDIERSLHILLSTRRGERIMQPTYGCNLDVLLFEPISLTLITYITDLIKTAIMYHEARITLNKVNVSDSDMLQGVVLIEVDYTVKSTNSRFNYVYPFYKNEKSNIS
jgi:phage baseplate assembly protein W